MTAAGSEQCVFVAPGGRACPNTCDGGRYCVEHATYAVLDQEIFRVVADQHAAYVREFWTRSNLYLAVTGALMSVFASIDHHDIQVVLAVFGILTSGFWFAVARGSYAWMRYWRAELSRIDLIVDRFQVFQRAENWLPNRSWKRPSWVTQWLPVVAAIGWIALLLAEVAG